MASKRIDKLNSVIQKILGQVLQGYLETIGGLVTISKVETSGDLRWAKIWVSIIGGNDEKILKDIQKNIYYIQGELNRNLEMKITPRLQFFLDTSPRYAQHIDELIKKIHAEDKG